MIRRALGFSMAMNLAFSLAQATEVANVSSVPTPTPKAQPPLPISNERTKDDIFNSSPAEGSVPPNVSQGPFSGAFRFRTQEELDSQKPTRIFWRGRIRGRKWDELADQEYITQFRLYSLGEYQLRPDLMFRGEIQAQFDSGYSQVIYTPRQQQQRNALKLNEVKVHWKPKYFSLEAGALNQDFFASPLLFVDQTFPAVREGVLIEEGSYGGGIFLQQAIPTGTTLSNPAAEKESVPRLATESVFAFVRPVENWFLEGSIHRYTFLDLPAVVAADSRRAGNSVSGSELNARFDYGYQGFVYGLRTHADFGKLRPALRYQIIKNQLADSGKDSGYWTQADLGYRVTPNVWLIPQFSLFSVESDSSPAFYAMAGFQPHNRNGWSTGFVVRHLSSRMRVSASYGESTPLTINPLQGPAQLGLLTLETDYASF